MRLQQGRGKRGSLAASFGFIGLPGRWTSDYQVLADTEGPQVDGFQLPKAEIQRLAGQGQAQRAGEGAVFLLGAFLMAAWFLVARGARRWPLRARAALW